MLYRYIEPAALRSILRNTSLRSPRDYLIVDVRDDDRVGGHIPTSINIPAGTLHRQLHDETDAATNEMLKNAGMVVFHCALSQQRGPKSARVYAEWRKYRATGTEAAEQEVLVLRGGFNTWQALYGDAEPDLLEGYERDVWRQE